MLTVVSSARLHELEQAAARCAELLPALERERATVATERALRESADDLLRVLLRGLLGDRAAVARGRTLLEHVPVPAAATVGAALHPVDAQREADGPDEATPAVATLSAAVVERCRAFAFGDRTQFSRNVIHARRLAQQGMADAAIISAIARGGAVEA